mmetsp:Transcript_27143/g.40094  ORF Transcript_27143/g.40094 Transcript_27143/m.40094 type:complete len:195 (-) Transcript_27143:27-611(-)
MMLILLYTFTLGAAFLISSANAFTNKPLSPLVSNNIQQRSHLAPTLSMDPAQTTTSLHLFPDPSSMLISDGDVSGGWRQYVGLGVSLFVIVDIVLGNPFANAILAPIKDQAEEGQKGGGGEQSKRRRAERVNSEKIAREAIEQASFAKELRQYLAENKTDQQKIEEMRAEMDSNFKKVDRDLRERQEKLEKGEF